MKIAILGSKGFDTLEFHLKDELKHQDNEVEIFDYEINQLSKKFDTGLELISQKYVQYKNKKLLDRVLSYCPDLVIATYRNVDPLVVKGIKKSGIKIIHVNPDAVTTFRIQQIFVEPYDHYFTKDPFIYSFMKDKMKLNTHLYYEAFNPRYHSVQKNDFEKSEKEVDIDVLSFGNLYPYRNRMLKTLLDNDIDVKIFGHKAKMFPEYLENAFQNRGIYGEEKAKILAGSKIVFNNFHYAEVESVNNKFFEINGSGAFQICDYKPILHELLPIDPKLVSFNTMDEAVQLINHYLNEPEERYQIRKIIHDHFLKNYTYKQMVKHILSYV